jgi:hypothetical protein
MILSRKNDSFENIISVLKGWCILGIPFFAILTGRNSFHGTEYDDNMGDESSEAKDEKDNLGLLIRKLEAITAPDDTTGTE